MNRRSRCVAHQMVCSAPFLRMFPLRPSQLATRAAATMAAMQRVRDKKGGSAVPAASSSP
eukprot:SAG11_NODE_30702_length_298_cov_1.040201_1_plen_59_part_10